MIHSLSHCPFSKFGRTGDTCSNAAGGYRKMAKSPPHHLKADVLPVPPGIASRKG